MENLELKKIFLEIAVAAISCDGHVDEREVEKLKEIEKSSSYFSEVDLSKELKSLLDLSMGDINSFQNDLFKKVENSDLDIVQQLAAIDVSLEIIQADGKVEQTEKDFVRQLRQHLHVTDEIVEQRFGVIDYLIESKKSEFNSGTSSVFNNIQTKESKRKDK